MTYGDLDFTDHLGFIENQVLSKFERKEGIPSELLLEPAPSVGAREKKVDLSFMPDAMSPPHTQAKFGLMFVCNEMCQDPYEGFKM